MPRYNNATVKRIISDLMSLRKDPVSNIHTYFNEEDIFTVKALIIGPENTPYEGGFYFFKLTFPERYPHKPPKGKYETTDGRIRFNPNLYANGYICLSILGTWSGPSWTSVQTLKSVLISLQSLLNDVPLRNEPGYTTIDATDSKALSYTKMVEYYNYRYAVLEMLKKTKHYPEFNEIIKEHFLTNYDKYVAKLEELKGKYQGEKVTVSLYGMGKVTLDYKKVLDEFVEYRKSLGDFECDDEPTSEPKVNKTKKTKNNII